MTAPLRKVQALTFVGTANGGPGVRLACGCTRRVESWEMAQRLRGKLVRCEGCSQGSRLRRIKREMKG